VSFTHDHDLAALRLIEPSGVQFKMYVTPRFEWRYVSNIYEAYTARLLGKMCERASLFVDVGAHYGFFTLHVASLRPRLKIIAIEPAKSNFEILNRNISFNGLKNVQTRNIAISDVEVEAPFHVFEASDNCGLHLHPQSRLLRTEVVQTQTIDALLESTKVGPLVIKIDTQGNELALLAGMKQTLQRFADVALFVEFNPKMLQAAGHDPSAFLQKIDELGLAIFLLDDKNEKHFRIGVETNWASYMKLDGYANLVCLPKNKALSVLFVSHSSTLGGAERSLLELLDELTVDHWVLTTVVCPREGALPTALRHVGASVCIESYQWWGALNEISDAEALIAEGVRSILRLLPQLRSVDPDVVWTQSMVIPWGAIVALLLGKRHVWSICEYGEKDHHLRFLLQLQDVIRFVERSSDFVFTGSPSLLRELLPNLGPDKADYLFRHIRVPKQRTAGRTNLWKVAGATRLAIFGTIQEGKGQEDLVRAAARLRKVQLLIVGSDSGDGYLARLQDLVEELGVAKKVTFPGFIPDPYAVMESADIVVSCSRAEAFGRTVIEAMLLGRAVIYSRSGAHLDYMIHGTTGLSYAPGDIDELVERIESLGARPELRKSLGEQACAYATKTFTRASYGGKVFDKLIALRDDHDRRTADMQDACKLFYAGLDTLAPSHTGRVPINGVKRPDTVIFEIEDRERRLRAADTDLRRLMAEAESGQRRLEAANVDLRRLMGEVQDRERRLEAADGDLRRLMGEMEGRDRRLKAADDDLRRLMGEIEDRDRRLGAADGDLRRLMDELDDRNRRLVAADGDLRRLLEEVDDRDRRLVAADGDLRRLMAEVEERERRLIAADGDARGLMAEVENRERRLVAADADLRRLLEGVEGGERRLVAADRDLRRLLEEVEDRDRRLTAADGDLRRLLGELEDLEHRLVAVHGELGRLMGDLGERDRQVSDLIAEVSARDRQLAAANEERQRLVVALDDRHGRLEVANNELRRILEKANLDSLRANSEVAERERQLERARQALSSLTEDLAQRDQQLMALARRLHEIETSAAWRATGPIRKLLSGWRRALSQSKM
jgi:FkbM family methyltransferase